MSNGRNPFIQNSEDNYYQNMKTIVELAKIVKGDDDFSKQNAYVNSMTNAFNLHMASASNPDGTIDNQNIDSLLNTYEDLHFQYTKHNPNFIALFDSTHNLFIINIIH